MKSEQEEEKENKNLGYAVMALIGIVLYFWLTYGNSSKAQSGVKQGEYGKEYTHAIAVHNKRELEEKSSHAIAPTKSLDSSYENYLDYVKRFKTATSFNVPQEDRCMLSKQVLEKAKLQTEEASAVMVWTRLSTAVCSLVK